MQIPVWIITLNEHSENVETLISDLTSQGFAPCCFPAVDGRHQTPKLETGERISQTKALINRKAPLTNSEIGCYLSHLRLIRKAFNEGLEHVFIVEDDIVIEDGLRELVSNILALNSNHHLVRLMSLKIRKRKALKSLTNDYTLVRPVRGALGTQGYILNREGMKKILDYGSTLTMPIDKLYDSFFLFGLNCYSIEPHAIYEIAHPSNIIKTQNGLDRRAWVTAGWRMNKLYRSIFRKINYLSNKQEYSGATKPKTTPGKSVRLRD